jgi:hypothetical protein
MPPLGKVMVVIRSGAPPVPMGAPEGPPLKTPKKIERIDLPAEYSDPAKTDLTYTVASGQTLFDIDMTSHSDPKEKRK